MEKQERYFWELFCATGEPRYYSMYIRERDRLDNEGLRKE